MNKVTGISSVIKIRNTQLELERIELQKQDSGKPREETRQYTLSIA